MNLSKEIEVEINESLFRVALLSNDIVHIHQDGIFLGEAIWDNKFKCLDEKDPIMDNVSVRDFNKLDEVVKKIKYN